MPPTIANQEKWLTGTPGRKPVAASNSRLVGWRVRDRGNIEVENRLFWPVISERSSCHSSFGTLRKTHHGGSNWLPEQRRISSRAASKLVALR